VGTVQVVVFWVITPCSLVDGYRHFQQTCFLHLQTTESNLLSLCHLEPNLSALKMDSPCSFEASVSICKIIPRYNPDHHHLNSLTSEHDISTPDPSVSFILLVSVWPTLTPHWLDRAYVLRLPLSFVRELYIKQCRSNKLKIRKSLLERDKLKNCHTTSYRLQVTH